MTRGEQTEDRSDGHTQGVNARVPPMTLGAWQRRTRVPGGEHARPLRIGRRRYFVKAVYGTFTNGGMTASRRAAIRRAASTDTLWSTRG